jgi:prepilin-type N-terminal cleavage/methylation domain-containing protein
VKRARGFTITELMVVVVIVGVMAGMAMVSFVRSRSEGQIDAFATAVRNNINNARNRAVATHSTYVVDVRPSSVQVCQVDPTVVPAQRTCPTPVNLNCNGAACENFRIVQAADDAIAAGYNLTVDRTGMAPTPLGGAGIPIYFFRDGTADWRTLANNPSLHVFAESGFTLYVRGVSPGAQAKQRKILVFPSSGRPRIIDKW